MVEVRVPGGNKLPCDIYKIASKGNKTFLLTHFYRPHEQRDWLQHFSDIVEYLSLNYSCPILLSGDFNCNILTTGSMVSSYHELCQMYGFSHKNRKPTRVTLSTKTCIDHLLVSDDDIVSKCDTYVSCSDHFAVVSELNLRNMKTPSPKYVMARSMKSINQNEFISDLQQAPWGLMDTFEDVNDQLHVFSLLFEEILDKHAPLKKVRLKKSQNKRWFNPEIDRLIKSRDLMRREIARSGTDDGKLSNLKKTIKGKIRSAKTNYFSEKIEEAAGNPKLLWKVLAEATQYNKSKSTCTFVNSNETANEYCNYFVNIPTVVNEELRQFSSRMNIDVPIYQGRERGAPIFEFSIVAEERVKNFFQTANSNKATGIDNISMKVWKMASEVVSTPLTKVLNNALISGKFPSKLKHAKITLIHKGGDASDKQNYRPISILPAISKLFERIVSEQLVNHAESNRLFQKFQSAYRRSHSTSTALLQMTDSWARSVDEGNITGILAIDLSKAFDCLGHEAIVGELKTQFGISEAAGNLFTSYLDNRKVVVSEGDHSSDPQFTKSGVPQGSILGPLLFSTALNNIGSVLNGLHFHIYADDLTVWVSSDKPEDIAVRLATIGEELFKFFATRGLKINTKKCQFMYVGSKQRLQREMLSLLPLDFLDLVLIPSESLKILGVTIDETLSFKTHIRNVIAKCVGKIKFLWRTASFLPVKHKKMLYNALILPHLTYCDIVWSPNIERGLMRRLESVQNSGVRFILGRDRRCSATFLRTELGWTTLENKFKIHYSSVVWQCLHGRAPQYLKDLLVDTRSVHGYDTRRRLYVQRRRLNIVRLSFYHHAPVEFNKLPENIKHASSLESFRSRMLKHLMPEL